MGMAGCSSAAHQSAPTTSTSSTSSTSPPPPTIGPGSGAAGGSSSTTSTTVAAGGLSKNLVATPALKAALLAAFASAKGDPQSDFTGPDPGTTYYALVPSNGSAGSTAQYWALAHFTPTSSAGYQVDVGMQDGGAEGVFTQDQGSPTWSVKFGTFPFPCPGGPVPDQLVKLWGMSYPSGCGEG